MSRSRARRASARRRGVRRRAAVVLLALAVVGAATLVGSRLADPSAGDGRCQARAGERVERLTAEQAAHAATISMVAVERGLPPRAATIALATALQESALQNLTYGDRDSLGLFQQRPSQGWGSAEQVQDPVHAAGAFYDALVQVPGWQDGDVTEVAQEVQRSAFPDAYARHEGRARVLASVLTGQVPAGLACELGPVRERGSARAVRAKAERQLGARGEVQGERLSLGTDDPTTAWAVAAWAVAHAEAEGVTEVEVAGWRWSRAEDPLLWSRPSEESQDTTVTVTLAGAG